MRSRALAAAVVLASLSARSVARPQDAPALITSTAIDRPLSHGTAHEFRLTLDAGDFARVVVDQRGIDVIVQVRDPAGQTIDEIDRDSTTQGREEAEIAATTGGAYTLLAKPAPGAVAAGAYAIRVVERRASTDADRSMQEARTLLFQANALDEAGDLEGARRCLERSLTLAESVRGPDDLAVVEIVSALADNSLDRRDNPRAEALFTRALSALDRAVGPHDPRDAIVRSRLAILFERIGQRTKADPLARQANDVFAQTLGATHLWYVRNLVTLGNLRDDAGDVESAKEIDARALTILDAIGETDTLLYAAILNNLGNFARETGDLARAAEMMQRALVMGERLRGPDSFYVSTTLQDLGIVFRERRDYDAAEAYELRALAIRERLSGPESTDVAQVLINLATIYRSKGNVDKSLETQHRALRIWETSGGPFERGTLVSAGNLARAYAGLGDLPHAIEFQRRTDALLELQLSLDLSIGSERERLASARAAAERTDRTISLHLNLAPDNQAAADLAALVLLQRKGRVLDAMADTLAAARRHADPQDIALLDQLHDTTTALAQAALKTPADAAGSRREAMTSLDARRERLEEDLSERSAEFRAQTLPVTVEAVQAAIPVDAALIEFVVFRPFNPKIEHNAEAYGPPHYAAYVLRRDRPPVGVDLGIAVPIDAAVHALRESLGDPRCRDFAGQARTIDRQVIAPLGSAITGATRLLVAPDGALNLVPFETLIGDDDKYLIERYAVTYLTSGRDLLRLQVPRASHTGPMIVANPWFGEPATATPAMYFAPLPSASLEARAIKRLFPEATLVTGRDATEARLAQLDAPRLLHIASHGFFLQSTSTVLNPLLRSGLALAGANLPAAGGNDGVLTALEAAGLNLWGTKLVTLSACDTGVGEIKNGEGVYGLRRAFVLAGSETLVMSLWPVSDRLTRETMTTYYTGLRAGLGRGDALRQAKLALLHRPEWSHPYYWASFIQSGEWAALDGRR